MSLRASAPGKMVLLGEYAVLFGAPALVMAVDRRARVEIESLDRAGGGYEIIAPDVCTSPVRLQLGADGSLSWQEGAEHGAKFALVSGILRGFVAAGIAAPAPERGLRIRLDTSAFFEPGGGGKLGLGSSAALTVALAGALAAWNGHAALVEERAAWLVRLLALHREFQNGHGSGIDLAASLYGATLRYQMAATDGRPALAMPVQWPDELRRLPVWSGSSASTASMLSSLEVWRSANPESADSRLAALCDLARQGVQAVESGDADTMLQAYDNYAQALQALGGAAKIAIFTAEHLAIGEIARRHGLAYKPSGAGGGDLGVAVGRESDAAPEVWPEFRQELSGAGYSALELRQDGSGFCIDY